MANRHVFGAFRPATVDAAHSCARHTGKNRIDFLERVKRWLPIGVTSVYAILDNLATHGSRDVLLFNVAYP